MLGEVVKFIMSIVGSIVGVIEWFFKPRGLRPTLPPQAELLESRVFSPAEQRHWRGYVVGDFVPLRPPTDHKRNC